MKCNSSENDQFKKRSDRVAPVKWVKVENIFAWLVMKNRFKLLISQEAKSE
jgi:hypothetical protein